MLIQSPLNYTGNKYRILEQLLKKFPSNIDTFYDVFCGSATVGINVNAKKIVCIDSCNSVIGLLKWIQENDYNDIINELDELIDKYHFSNTYLNGYAQYHGIGNLGLSRYNKEPYNQLRNDYNQEKSDVLFFMLIIFGFNNQIRFNSKGEFNLPVGKRDLNKRLREKLKNFSLALKEKNIEFQCKDFRNIDIMKIRQDDFVYCDPPYLLGTASYNSNWSEKDDMDLMNFLDNCNQHHIRFALSDVLEHNGKRNDRLIDWVNKNYYIPYRIRTDYHNSNYHKNNKEAETKEVLVKNLV